MAWLHLVCRDDIGFLTRCFRDSPADFVRGILYTSVSEKSEGSQWAAVTRTSANALDLHDRL
jgi:hypothetical protein